MSNFQLNDDDVVSIDPKVCPMPSRTMRISEMPEGFKKIIQPAAVAVAGGITHDMLNAWLNQGIECEFLRASTGGGWQTGKIRVRFEFIPDVPDPADSLGADQQNEG